MFSPLSQKVVGTLLTVTALGAVQIMNENRISILESRIKAHRIRIDELQKDCNDNAKNQRILKADFKLLKGDLIK